MSYGASDEVAEDFKVALEDLTMNSRYEISNLTIIAKENTENALAISEALKDHIKRVGEAFSYCRSSLLNWGRRKGHLSNHSFVLRCLSWFIYLR